MTENQSQAEHFDIVVLGSGEAGKYIAWTLAKKGKKSVVIERKWVGGSCPNIACLPSKNIIHSAKVASYFFRSEEFGIHKHGTCIDMSLVRERKRKMVAGLMEMHLGNFRASGAHLVMGSGKFVAPKTIEVVLADGGVRHIQGENVVISTGSRALVEAIPGLLAANPLTHLEALELDEIPQHLLILGGGFIGLEFAQAMRRFGSRVTVIDRNSRLVHREDQDVSEALHRLFKDEGIDFVGGLKMSRVEGTSGKSIRLFGMRDGTEVMIEGTHLMVATGRTPNTENIGLDLAGVETTDRGHVKVNDRLQTTAPGVWAVGDCAGSPHFTHIAFDDFRVVRDNLMGVHKVTTGRQTPACVFTDPELARIGLDETAAKQQGIEYILAKIPMMSVLRSRTLSETRGFMKALIAEESDKILGFTAFGIGAGEVMGTVQVAMMAGLPYTALRDAIFTHPTLTEGLIPLFSTVLPKS